MESAINKELIFSHFARKSSPLQRELITQWLQHEANEEQYYSWLEEWEIMNPQYLAQSESAIDQFRVFLDENPHEKGALLIEQPAQASPGRWNRSIWLVAASVLIVLGLSAFLFRSQLWYTTYETAFGETRSVKLEDGSLVFLNANSTISVPRWGFGSRTREVLMTGEARFSVTHTIDNQRFVVKTANDFDVVVLGTEFTVFARNRGARVALTKGKVEVHYQENKASKLVTMKPGDLITLDSQNRMALKTIKQPEEQASWREQRFVFEETSLQEVAYMLEENYGLRVVIKDSVLAKRVLMGSFQAQNVDQLLQSISELLDINVVRQGTYVQLTDK